MSEFKFACPVCGQHITCDSSSSGSQMSCPTCFRKLVVPAAPESHQFVLTAAEVTSRPTSAPRLESSPAPVAPVRRWSLVTLVVGVGICAVLAAAVTLGVKKYRHTAKKAEGQNLITAPIVVSNPPPVLGVTRAAADATNWTLNLTEAVLPSNRVQGAVRGYAFKLDRAVIQGGRLDLRQGPKWPPDLGVSLHLFADHSEDLAGRTVVLEATRTNAPRLILRWKDAQDQAMTKEFRKGYAARVEFGQVRSNRLAGKIYLAAPDEERSYVAGTFEAEIRKPQPPKP